jgi:hypothetical protein
MDIILLIDFFLFELLILVNLVVLLILFDVLKEV